MVVSVKADRDFPANDPLHGIEFQRSIEKKAYELSLEYASGRELPAQRVVDFLEAKITAKLPKTSCPSGVFPADMNELFPSFIAEHLGASMETFNRQMKGFAGKEALFIAPETRTSSPVTISRDRDTNESLSHSGLYPCGEGAGYAGGITSAAVDGVKVAMSLIRKEKSFE